MQDKKTNQQVIVDGWVARGFTDRKDYAGEYALLLNPETMEKVRVYENGCVWYAKAGCGGYEVVAEGRELAEEPPKVAWLIEQEDALHPGCVTGLCLAGASLGEDGYAVLWEEPDKAIRFCRKEDAEAVGNMLNLSIPWLATEHQWG